MSMRSHRWARLTRPVLLALPALALAFALPASGQAATTLGEINTSVVGDCSGFSIVQEATLPNTPSYTVPTDGVLTAWSNRAKAGLDNNQIKLKVYRRTTDPAKFFTVGESISQLLTPSFDNVFPLTPGIPVQAGDLLGVSAIANMPSCTFTSLSPSNLQRDVVGDPAVGSTATMGAPYQNARLNLTATLEPDADGDGFGDETGDKNAPALAGASVSPKTFRVDSAGAPARASKRAPKGTTFRYTISKATKAKVTFTIEKKAKAKGRKVRGKCVKRKRSNRRKPKCTRYSSVGSFTQDAVGGANSKAFSGKIGARKLGRGSYRATLVARDAAGNASPGARVTFKIVR